MAYTYTELAKDEPYFSGIQSPGRCLEAHASLNFENFESLLHQRKRHGMIRSQATIVAAILEACRTPSVQHWIMVQARLGYDTFWKHMNALLSRGMMNAVSDGHRTLYSINEKGLNLLRALS